LLLVVTRSDDADGAWHARSSSQILAGWEGFPGRDLGMA
jgi:hypothetical protein